VTDETVPLPKKSGNGPSVPISPVPFLPRFSVPVSSHYSAIPSLDLQLLGLAATVLVVSGFVLAGELIRRAFDRRGSAPTR
jgi:hypothetical protein